MKYIIKLRICLFVLMFSCKSKYVEFGYYKNEDNISYYGNDSLKLYLLFSNDFHYSKENFHADHLTEEDIKLFRDFNIKRSRKILFAYHSKNSRNVMAYLPRKKIKKDQYERIKTSQTDFYFKIKEDSMFIYKENIFSYKHKYIAVIEKTYKTPHKHYKPEPKTYIYPEISNIKPLTKNN